MATFAQFLLPYLWVVNPLSIPFSMFLMCYYYEVHYLNKLIILNVKFKVNPIWFELTRLAFHLPAVWSEASHFGSEIRICHP